MTDLPGYDIRYTIEQDERALKQWLLGEDTLRWFPMKTEKEVEEGIKNWIGFSKYKASLTAQLFNQPCGIGTLFLMPYRKIAHHAMFYIVVDPKHRGKKIGESLLKNLINLADKYFRLESIHCEVFEDCPLIPLLKKFQFDQCVHQEKFVKEKEGKYLSRYIFEYFIGEK